MTDTRSFFHLWLYKMSRQSGLSRDQARARVIDYLQRRAK